MAAQTGEADCILALDQGTSSSRALVFDRQGNILAQRAQEFRQQYPRPGWVEQVPEDIWRSQTEVARQAVAALPAGNGSIVAAGITNQRETTIVWDRRSGEPVYNAIVWQDRRTAGACARLKQEGLEPAVRSKTGLLLDPYFSATKVAWILDNVPGARRRAERGELLFGTVDTFLLWRLTGGRVHATDCSNASRTLLFNLRTLDWDDDLLHAFAVPRAMLPQVLDSSGVFGSARKDVLGVGLPVAGMAGDQQAATFGQACFSPGMVKNTYGTGNFMVLNVGSEATEPAPGLLTTVLWRIGSEVVYGLEGSVFVTGATLQWLRDELGLLGTAAESETLARSVESTDGVYLVPAFTGLGTPHWDPQARGLIVGLTRGSGRAHIVRAALEAVAYQTRDVLDLLRSESGLDISELRVDGGMAPNDFLLQFQADVANIRVQRPRIRETTALGAAYLAGLATGFWSGTAELRERWTIDREFLPEMPERHRAALYAGWQRAVDRARGWAEPDGE